MGNTEIIAPIGQRAAPAASDSPKDVPAQAFEAESAKLQHDNSETPAPSATDSKAAFAARMARFNSLKVTGTDARAKNAQMVKEDTDSVEQAQKDPDGKQARHDEELKNRAEVNLSKATLGPERFERKRAMDYTSAEAEAWEKGQRKKQKNRNNVAFSDWQAEAHKNYKRQLRNLGKVDLDAYLAEKAQKLQNQVTSGLLELVETDDGEIFTVDKQGRINTPVDEAYIHGDHKPSKDAVDRLVADLNKAERARLKARAARGLNDDDNGDVTYINQKNKQFNDKLARFYNRYTTEIRESFERGTAM